MAHADSSAGSTNRAPGAHEGIGRAEAYLMKANALLYSAEMLDMRADRGLDERTLGLIREARDKLGQAILGTGHTDIYGVGEAGASKQVDTPMARPGKTT